MNTKHTPGPWRIGNAGKAIFQPTGIKLVADLSGLDNAKANACLIAKAPELTEALEQMVANLIEAHASEFEDGHAGDADHDGEAPEACSYCKDIAEARELLLAAGHDISAITPQTEEN